MLAHKSMTVWLLALVLAVPLLGCASTRTAANTSTAAPAGEDCFNASLAESFSYLRERYVYVRTLNNKHYLLTLANECIGLQGATGMAVHSRFDWVCSDSGAVIEYNNFSRPYFCRIIKVQQVKDKAAAEALVEKLTAPRGGSD